MCKAPERTHNRYQESKTHRSYALHQRLSGKAPRQIKHHFIVGALFFYQNYRFCISSRPSVHLISPLAVYHQGQLTPIYHHALAWMAFFVWLYLPFSFSCVFRSVLISGTQKRADLYQDKHTPRCPLPKFRETLGKQKYNIFENFNLAWHTKGIEKNVVLCYNKIEIDTLEQIYAVSYIFIFVSDYNNIFYCS